MSTKSWEPCGHGGHAYGSDCRDAARQQAAPVGQGDVVLDAVLQRLNQIFGHAERHVEEPRDVINLEQLAAVRKALIERAEFGEKKYGTKLRILNGRSASLDCYQELLDAIMYAMQARMENRDSQTAALVEILIGLAAQISEEAYGH